MRKIKCIVATLFAICSLGLVSSSATAQTVSEGPVIVPAHVGDFAHVGFPRWNSRNDLTYQFVDDPGHWTSTSKDNMRDAINGIDNKLSFLPDLHVGPCSQNPGKCINMTLQACDGGPGPENCPRTHYSRGDFYTMFIRANNFALTQRAACFFIIYDFGLHQHRSHNGCNTLDFDTWEGTLSPGEVDALNAEYCGACRVITPGEENDPAEEDAPVAPN